MKPVLTVLVVGLVLGCSSGGGGGNGGNGTNTAPVARAGPDQAVDVGTTVALDGRESYDADGDALTYRWSLESTPAGSAAVLVGGDAVRPTFVPDQGGTYRVRLLVNDGKADGAPAAVQVTAVAGALLAGDRAGLAVDALTDVPPLAVDPGQVENGVIMTRLDLRLRMDATVGQVNDALSQVGARIVTMRPGLPTVTVSIPRPTDLAALHAVVQALRQAPGIRFASVGRVSTPKLVPTDDAGFLADLTYLMPTRFPAAWNAGKLAIASCGSVDVHVLVADVFMNPAPGPYATRFPAEVSGFVAVPPGETGESEHGFDVTTTLAAHFDLQHPTGANPFPGCLQVMGIRLSNLTTFQESDRIERIASGIPTSGKFILNYSVGYVDTCDGPCSASTFSGAFDLPLGRAYDAAEWKLLTHARWGDFLVATAAGNEGQAESAQIYPGLAMARYGSSISMATLLDPYFASITDPGLWSANPSRAGFPSLAATDAEAADLAEHVRALGLDTMGPASNVLVTGGTTSAGYFVNLAAWPYSDSGSDVKAASESISTLQGDEQGTSFSSPQVAGLASYLWLLSTDLRSRPAQDTKEAILANARGNANTDGIIDAYASVLSLDQAVAPTPLTAPIRLAILDVDENGVFDESDVELYLRHYFDTSGNPLEAGDCGRFDLNGDCFTGGAGTERFDLDRAGSTQYGNTAYSVVTQDVEGWAMYFDEGGVTDVQVLCYYAYSPTFYRGDTTRRKDLLEDRCWGPEPGPVSVWCAEAYSGAGDSSMALTAGQWGDAGGICAFTSPLRLPLGLAPSSAGWGARVDSRVTLQQVAPDHVAIRWSLSEASGPPRAYDPQRPNEMLPVIANADFNVVGLVQAGSYTVRFNPAFAFPSNSGLANDSVFGFGFSVQVAQRGRVVVSRKCAWYPVGETYFPCWLPMEANFEVPDGSTYYWNFGSWGLVQTDPSELTVSGPMVEIMPRQSPF